MYCTHCGKELFENARFCQACGTPVAGVQAPPPAEAPVPTVTVVPDETALFEEERTFLTNLYGALNRERSAWKIVGVVLLVSAIVWWFVTGATVMVYGEETAAVEWLGGCAILSLVGAVINLRMTRKLRRLCTTMYTDVRPVIDRYSGVGPVVLALFVKLIAMALVIDGRNKIKSKTAVLQRIVQRQQLPQDI